MAVKLIIIWFFIVTGIISTITIALSQGMVASLIFGIIIYFLLDALTRELTK